MSEAAARAMLRVVANRCAAARAIAGTVHDLGAVTAAWDAGIAEYCRIAGLEGDPAALSVAERQRSAALEAQLAEAHQALAEKETEAATLRADLAAELAAEQLTGRGP